MESSRPPPPPPPRRVLLAFPCSVSTARSHNVVGVFRGYTSLAEHERDGEGNVQMGEVVI